MKGVAVKPAGTAGPRVAPWWSAIARRQWELCLKNHDAAMAGDIEALHDLRVALRRLRVWLRIHNLACSDSSAKSLERRLRRMQKWLGPARDADIALVAVQSWPVKSKKEKRVRAALEKHLQEMSRREREDVAERLHSASWNVLADRVDRYIEQLAKGTPVSEPLIVRLGRAVIRRLARQVRGRYRKLTDRSANELHRLRIAVRRLRYAAEFFERAMEEKTQRIARAARKLQDVLGDIHDVDIITALLQKMPEAQKLGIGESLDAHRCKLLKRFDRIWRETKPYWR